MPQDNPDSPVNSPVDPEWWKYIFDEIYLVTDARTIGNEELTRSEADLIEHFLGVNRDDPILDLCGGQGRHSLELARRGYTGLTTLDYSEYLLELGAGSGHSDIRFIRADARRLPIRENSYRAVALMACSFGYFADDSQNAVILREAWRVLVPSGVLLVDIADGDKVAKSIAENSWHEADSDILVLRKRKSASGGLEVRELVVSRKKGLIRESSYFEKLYSAHSIRELVASSGFSKIEVHRGLDKLSSEADLGFMSTRMIVTARKKKRSAKR